jgi:hypothetical protein
MKQEYHADGCWTDWLHLNCLSLFCSSSLLLPERLLFMSLYMHLHSTMNPGICKLYASE